MTNIFKRIGGMLRSLKKKNNFTIISNTILLTKGVSSGAVCSLLRLISLSATWRYTFEGFVSQCKEGKTAVRSYLDELTRLHYFDEVQLKRKNGRFGGKAVIVNDEPMPKEVLEQIKKMITESADEIEDGTIFSPKSFNLTTGRPSTENPSTENQTQSNNNNTRINKQILSCPVPKSESNCNLTEETEDLSEIDFDMTDEEESYDALAGIEEEEAAKEAPDLFDVEKFKEQISYDKLVKDKSDSYTKQVKALLGVVSNALNHKEKLRISGRDMPLKAVADKFSLLRYEHISHVLETINKRLSDNKKPKDIKAYLLTMLYNSVDEYESKHISAFDKPVPETGNSFDLDEIEIIENSFAVSEDSCPSFTLEDLRDLANNFDNFI